MLQLYWFSYSLYFRQDTLCGCAVLSREIGLIGVGMLFHSLYNGAGCLHYSEPTEEVGGRSCVWHPPWPSPWFETIPLPSHLHLVWSARFVSGFLYNFCWKKKRINLRALDLFLRFTYRPDGGIVLYIVAWALDVDAPWCWDTCYVTCSGQIFELRS